MCSGEVVVEVLFYCKYGLASWWVHLLKLTKTKKQHILLSEHILVVISNYFFMIRSRNVGCSVVQQSDKVHR